ncbi:MAG: hypothetical protein ACOYU3_03120 [Bacillota bacterium]
MDRVWAVIRTDQKITNSCDLHCAAQFWRHKETLSAILETLCQRLEISHPVWLSKHTREMDRFGRTDFREEDFMESIFFDALELEFISEKTK